MWPAKTDGTTSKSQRHPRAAFLKAISSSVDEMPPPDAISSLLAQNSPTTGSTETLARGSPSRVHVGRHDHPVIGRSSYRPLLHSDLVRQVELVLRSSTHCDTVDQPPTKGFRFVCSQAVPWSRGGHNRSVITRYPQVCPHTIHTPSDLICPAQTAFSAMIRHHPKPA